MRGYRRLMAIADPFTTCSIHLILVSAGAKKTDLSTCASAPVRRGLGEEPHQGAGRRECGRNPSKAVESRACRPKPGRSTLYATARTGTNHTDARPILDEHFNPFRSWFCLFLLLFCLPTPQAHGFTFTPEICRAYGLGSHWHCHSETEETPSEPTAQDILTSHIPAEQKAVQLNALWETQIKRATISEKPEDIRRFLETHHLIASKGIQLAHNVQKILETSPQLFHTESYYKNLTEQHIRAAENQQLLRHAHPRYGLVFIYSASCPHCERQLPLLLRLRDTYRFKLLGITADHLSLPGFDEQLIDPSIAHDPLITSVPTILLLDKQRPGKIFISKGLTTLDELEENIAKRIRERQT